MNKEKYYVSQEEYDLFDLSFFPFMFGIIMFSIFLAYIYRKTNSVFFCAFFHSLYNTLTTIFITNIGSLIIELLLALLCIVLYYKEKKLTFINLYFKV